MLPTITMRTCHNLYIRHGMDSEPFDMNCLHPNFNSNRRPLRCRWWLHTRVRQSSTSAFPPYRFSPCSQVFHTSWSFDPKSATFCSAEETEPYPGHT